jgi:hypothetical protein
MAFIKFAKTERLGFWEADMRIVKTAATASQSSHFANGGVLSAIDIKAALTQVADKYKISNNPSDYIYEAVRAVTAGVPNENGDAFSKNELLRYDHNLKKPVYQTFQLVPHFVNHQSSKLEAARGVILDAYYNDTSKPFDSCNACGYRTAQVEDRDATGLYCKKCGAIAKDEFVEILIATDSKKDPHFANGVRTGVLNATSMGCFVPGTLVTMANGTKKEIQLIAPGDKVVTHTGAIAEVEDTSEHPCNGEIVELTVSGVPANIQATQNHELWVVNPETGTGQWIEAGNVKPGQYMLSPRLSDESIVEESKSFARLAGWFAAEGNFIKAYDGPHTGKIVGLEFSLGITERNYAEEIAKLLSDLGADPGIYERKSRNLLVVKAYRCIDLANKMFAVTGQHAHNKILSSDVLHWNKENQLAFIGAFIDGDGTVINKSAYKDADGKNHAQHKWTSVTTVSHDLCSQLTQMLVNLGIPHRINVRNNVSGWGSERPAYYITVAGSHQQKLASVSNKVTTVGFPTGQSNSHSVANDKGILRKITGVNLVSYEGPVYNFGVKHEDHSYVAGGLAVHNCSCISTTCNVCNNVAHTKQQFCRHIRSNKKKMFQTANGERQAFEWCNDVIFTEDSRVDQPADPTALQREILQLSASIEEHKKVAQTLHNESEILILTKRMNDLKAEVDALNKSAQKHSVGDGTPIEELTEQAVRGDVGEGGKADPPTDAEVGFLNIEKAPNSGTSGGAGPTSGDTGITGDSIGSGKAAFLIDNDMLNEMATSVWRSATTGDYKGEPMSFKFKTAYDGISAAVTTKGNCRVYTKTGTLFVVRPDFDVSTREAKMDFAKTVLASVAEHGLIPTMNSFNVLHGPKLASILSNGLRDLGGEMPKGDKGISEGGNETFSDKERKFWHPDSQQDKVEVNHTEKPKAHNKSMTEKHTTDIAGTDTDKPEDSVTSNESATGSEHNKGKKFNVGSDTAIDSHEVNHKGAAKSGKKTAQAMPPDAGIPPAPGSPGAEAPPPDAGMPGDVGDMGAMPPPGADAGKKFLIVELSGEGDDVKAVGEPATITSPEDTSALEQMVSGQNAGLTDVPDSGATPADDELAMEAASASRAAPSASKEASTGTPPAPSAPSASKAPPAPAGKAAAIKKDESTSKKACECGKPGCKDCGTRKASTQYESRLSRLYKNRLAAVKSEFEKREASTVDVVASTFKRALKLAAARQQLNLEMSPIKAAFAETLMSNQDLGNNEVYPGMDERLAVQLTEQATASGMDEFIDKLITRAAELSRLPKEAFEAMDADVKNLQPVLPPITASAKDISSGAKREAASSGNFAIPATPHEEFIPHGGRSLLKSALGRTTVGVQRSRVTGSN